MASSTDRDTDLFDEKKNLQTDQFASDLTPNVTELLHLQQQLLEDNRQFRQCLQRHDAAIENLIQLLQRLTETRDMSPSIKSATSMPVHNNSQSLCSMSSTDQSTKQLRSKQISQLFESTSFSGSPMQDVVDWLHEFNRKCDDIVLDDVQRLSIARGLMTDDAKLWTETLNTSLVDWSSFQKKLVAYFQLAAGIDSFSFNEQLYTRQQQLHESAIHYYHDVMRLCSKVELLMDNVTRLRHLYRGLRPESKVLISIHTFHSPDDFLQELVRLEHLQAVSDCPQSNVSTLTIAPQNSGPGTMAHPPYHGHQGFPQQSLNLQSANHAAQGPRFHQPSSEYRHRQQPSSTRPNRHLNAS